VAGGGAGLRGQTCRGGGCSVVAISEREAIGVFLGESLKLKAGSRPHDRQAFKHPCMHTNECACTHTSSSSPES
jgi:hypothetical protein